MQHIQTRTHAPTAEMFIRTFKDSFYRSFNYLKQDKSTRIEHVDDIIKHITIHNSLLFK